MSLKQTIVSAVGWSVGIKLVIQVVTWAMTLIVIRLLTPDDYGLAAVSQIFANVMMGFAALGLGDALIQKEETPKIIVARVFGMLLVSSAALTIGLALAAYPIANWYNDQRLVALIQVSSLGFMFNGLSSLPRAYHPEHGQCIDVFSVGLQYFLQQDHRERYVAAAQRNRRLLHPFL